MSIDVKVVFTYIGAHPEYLTLLYNLGSEGVRRSKKGLYGSCRNRAGHVPFLLNRSVPF